MDFGSIIRAFSMSDIELKCADENLDSDFALFTCRDVSDEEVIMEVVEDRSAFTNNSTTSSKDDEPPIKRLRRDNNVRRRSTIKTHYRTTPRPLKNVAENQSTRLRKVINEKNEDRCEYCNEKGFLVCCDFCTASFHLRCHTPSLISVPKGSFQCYHCYWLDYYERNPIGCKAEEFENVELQYLHGDRHKLMSILWMQEIRLMTIQPYTIPEHLKSFIINVPTLLPHDELIRRNKRKRLDNIADCYVCQRACTNRDANQCSFCPNSLHLDCDPRPSCAVRLYAWRCPLHVENYLDTYFLQSTSVYRRVSLWFNWAQQPLNIKETEHKFVKSVAEAKLDDDTVQVAKTLLTLKVTTRKNAVNKILNTQNLKFKISPHLSLLYSDVFQNPRNVAAFLPCFETTKTPPIYNGRGLWLGTSDQCTFNLTECIPHCKNISEVQLVVLQKQGLHYLCHGGHGGLTRVNGVFLADGRKPVTYNCACVMKKNDTVQTNHVYRNIAIFPDKVYTVQLGCAEFYLVFNPRLVKSRRH